MMALPEKWSIPASYGWASIPLHPRDKRPALASWRQYIETPPTASEVERWASNDAANVGIVTGAVSGIVVLDLDTPEAMAEAERRGLPDTPMVRTGKGRHVYFAHPGAPMKNRAGFLDGMDIRADGGFVVAPGSVHPSGAVYRWERHPDETPLASMPTWLADMLVAPVPKAAPEGASRPVPAQASAAEGTDTPYGLAALEREATAIRGACEGQQDSTLNNAALKVGALVAGGELSHATARAKLIGAGSAMPSYDAAMPWTLDDVVAKVDRAMSDGAASPRKAPPREYRDAAFAYGKDAFRYDPATGELHPGMGPGPAADDGAIEFLDWQTLANVEPRRKAFIIPGLAPVGEVTLFSGPGSAGKSLFVQQVATALAAGVRTLGLDLEQAPAAYFTCEDDADELHWREAAICRALGVPMADLAGRLHIATLRGRLDNALGMADGRGNFVLGTAYKRITAAIAETGARFVALDNVAHLFAGNENDRGEVTQFANALNRLAGETGAAIMVLGHTNKAFVQGHTQGNGASGSTAWVNAVRSQIVLAHDPETDIRTITAEKANYARKGEALRCIWHDGALVLESDLPPDTARALAETTKANGENTAFLRCLAACTAQKRNVSHQPGSNYAPKVFAGMTEAKGIKAPRFAAAMERLLHVGRIELDADLWPGPNRHPKRGIRLVEGME